MARQTMDVIRTVSNSRELDEHLVASNEHDVWFFKHSSTCGISTAAWREFESFVGDANGDDSALYCLVEMQHARDVSQALAEKLAVRHESPQAILVRRGEAVWHASHWSITKKALGAVKSELR